jgi:transposase-like protein
MEQKQRFINLAQSGRFTVSELSEEFGITRKTGHKWLLGSNQRGQALIVDICSI